MESVIPIGDIMSSVDDILKYRYVAYYRYLGSGSTLDWPPGSGSKFSIELCGTDKTVGYSPFQGVFFVQCVQC